LCPFFFILCCWQNCFSFIGTGSQHLTQWSRKLRGQLESVRLFPFAHSSFPISSFQSTFSQKRSLCAVPSTWLQSPHSFLPLSSCPEKYQSAPL
jgi:hypothetical protein